MERILNCSASDFGKPTTPLEIKQAILASEGRTILVDLSAGDGPLYPAVTNGEMAAAFGADLLLLKAIDVQKLDIAGLGPIDHLQKFRDLTGTAVGLNLVISDSWPLYQRVSDEAVSEIVNKGADFLSITAYAWPEATPERIAADIRKVRAKYDGFLMLNYAVTHGADILTENIQLFIDSGIDMISLPAPGSVPGVTEGQLAEIGRMMRGQGVLLDCVVGTSQEGADQFTIQNLALSAKRAGCDVFEFGDAGLAGMPAPEAILNASVSLRGKRHTYVRMARSANR
ncbi:DUF7916 family protein [Lactovum odontotermitis]